MEEETGCVRSIADAPGGANVPRSKIDQESTNRKSLPRPERGVLAGSERACQPGTEGLQIRRQRFAEEGSVGAGQRHVDVVGNVVEDEEFACERKI